MKKIKIIKSRPIKEEEEVIDQQDQDVAPQQPEITYESNPLEFMLMKYPTLTKTLTDLLTDNFRDYIVGVYIMAPKPTIFKIVLHNNRSFHLIFMGDDKYEAKVSGKKYWLASVGDFENAVMSIADLLMLGTPPSTQGPETETASTPEETPAETPEETPEEEAPEELAESKKNSGIRLLKEAFTIFPTSDKEINNPDIKKLFNLLTKITGIESPISLDPGKPNVVNITRELESNVKAVNAIEKLTGEVISKTTPIKWNSLKIKFGEGSKGGRGVKSKGLGFEGALTADLEEYNINGFNNEENFQYLGLVKEIVKEFGLKPGNFTVVPEGKKNQSRPLVITSKGPEISFTGDSAAATLTDITIDKGGKKYFISCKFGSTLTFFNSGVTKIFPKSEIDKGNITNPSGKKVLDTFGIKSKIFCKIFQAIGDKTDFSKYNGPTSNYDEAAVKNLIKSGIGSGYYMAWASSASDYYFYKIDEKYTEKASQIQGGMNVLYGGSGGTGERVDITFESPLYSFKVNIRNKQGGQYPSHIMCDYKKK